jgi:hypothetical protein
MRQALTEEFPKAWLKGDGARYVSTTAANEAIAPVDDVPPELSPRFNKGGRYPNLFMRLLANSRSDVDPDLDPETASPCWFWTGKTRSSKGGAFESNYGGINIYIPGLKRIRTFTTHRVMAILKEIGHDASADQIYLAYKELEYSGLEVDHMCECYDDLNKDPNQPSYESCVQPAHLQFVTPPENIELSQQRWDAAKRFRDDDSVPAAVVPWYQRKSQIKDDEPELGF